MGAFQAGIVGFTPQQVIDIQNLKTPPAWFRDFIEPQLQMSLTPEGLQKAWDDFVSKIKNRARSAMSKSSFEEMLIELSE